MSIVFLHGMGGSAKDWQYVAKNKNDFCVNYPFAETLNATVNQLLSNNPIQTAQTICGYSMGGRMAACLAAKAQLPNLQKLVLVSSGLGFENPLERQSRESWDANWVQLFTENPQAFWQKWYAQDIFKGLESLATEKKNLLESLRKTVTLEQIKRDLLILSPAKHDYLLPQLKQISTQGIEIVFLAGAMDKKYVEVAKILEQSGIARVEIVPEKGHFLPMEEPAAVARAVYN